MRIEAQEGYEVEDHGDRVTVHRSVVETLVGFLIVVPEKGGTYVYAAKVPWSAINDARDLLERSGIDWRTACRRYHETRVES